MAKGRLCWKCNYYMLAVSETEEPKGSYVVYQCRACGLTEKVFESK